MTNPILHMRTHSQLVNSKGEIQPRLAPARALCLTVLLCLQPFTTSSHLESPFVHPHFSAP